MQEFVTDPKISDEFGYWSDAHARQEFGSLISHACDASHFLSPRFQVVVSELRETFHWHRKLWEYATICEIAKKLIPSLTVEAPFATGFGVGREPITSFLAAHGYQVLATDLPLVHKGNEVPGSAWASSQQHAAILDDLWKKDIIEYAPFSSAVQFREVDMNNLPSDLPSCNFIWSSCVIEHLGGFRATKAFLVNASELLLPGGVMVHTTELELCKRRKMADYGNCAVFRPTDIVDLIRTLRQRGLVVYESFFLPMESYFDRYISPPPYESSMPHLKLRLAGSIATSYAIVAMKPALGIAA